MDYWVVGDLHQALQNMDLEALDYVLREEGGPGLRSGDLGVGLRCSFSRKLETCRSPEE